MFSRVFVGVAAIVLATTMSFVGVSGVNASTYDPEKECGSEAWEKWGNNCDGFHVIITNNTGKQLDFWKFWFRNGVYDYLQTIDAGVTTVDGDFLGRQMIGGGGPRNMKFSLWNPKSAEWRFVDIATNSDGTLSPRCGKAHFYDDWGPDGGFTTVVKQWGKDCNVSSTSPKDPVHITFS